MEEQIYSIVTIVVKDDHLNEKQEGNDVQSEQLSNGDDMYALFTSYHNTRDKFEIDDMDHTT